MDKYQRVEREKKTEDGVGAAPMEANEVRITQQGQVRSYISYANGLFTDKKETKVVLKAMGHAISKAVSVAEVLKHRVVGLHQITQISSIETIEVYEPLEEGLDRVEQKRSIPGITIELSLEPLDATNPGYQPPIAEELVTAQVDDHDRAARRQKKPRAGVNAPTKGKDRQPKTPAMVDAGVAVSLLGLEEQQEPKQESAEDTKEAGSGGGKPSRGTRSGRERGGGRGSGRGRGRGRGERGERNDDAGRIQRDVAVVTGGASATALSGNNGDEGTDATAAAAVAPKIRPPRKKKTPFSGDADQQTKTAADRAAETTDNTADGGDREPNGAGRGGHGGRGARGRGGGRGGGGGRVRGRGDEDGGRGNEVEGKAAVAAAVPVAPVSAAS